MTDSEVLARAVDGDEVAWRQLVDQYMPLVWAVARSHRLQGADAADAVQSTWLALAQNLATIRRPDRLAAWLTTTARRESIRILRQAKREVPLETFDVAVTVEPRILQDARDKALWTAFGQLPARCRKLLGLLAHAPELTYVQLSAAVGLRVSSIGRTKGRCLDELRRLFIRLEGAPK